MRTNAPSRPVFTNVVDVFDRSTPSTRRDPRNALMSLDASDARAAAREFAHTWRHGLIDRANDHSAPCLTGDEIRQLAGREYGQDVVLCPRYEQDGRTVYPEAGHPPIDRHISKLCGEAWRVAQERIERDNQERRQAVTSDNERYAEGLRQLEDMSAASRLKSQIMAIEDAQTRREYISRYPELFSQAHAIEAAQEQREAEHDGQMAEWLEAHPELQD